MPDSSFDEGDEEGTSPMDEENAGQAKGADEQFCSSCGEVIKKEAEICPKCGVRQKGASSGGEKNPGIAAVLSFIWTGAGQIYNGQIMKGIGLIVLQVVNVLLMFVLIGFLTFPATWFYGIYDAYKTAEKINAGEITV